MSYLAVVSVGMAFAIYMLQVQRAPLPLDEVTALSASVGTDSVVPWPKSRIRIRSLPGAFDRGEDLKALVQSLAASLESDDVIVSEADGAMTHLETLGPCVDDKQGASASACLKVLEEDIVDNTAKHADGTSASLASNFDLLIVPTSEDCSTLLLSTGQSAILRWHRRAPLEGPIDLASTLALRLRETWLRRTRLEHVAALFEVAPAYVFSFFLVGDCHRRIAWDFPRGVLAPYLQRFLARLRLLVDFEIDSQVVQCGSLGGKSGAPAESESDEVVIDASTLRADFLRRAGEWPGDTLTSGARWMPPLVRFVAFKPSRALGVVDAQKQPQRSFAVPGWGTVAITNNTYDGADVGLACASDGKQPNDVAADVLTRCEAQHVASAWVSNLRSWLTLPPDGPIAGGNDAATCSEAVEGLALMAARPILDGIANWEVRSVAREFHTIFVRRTAATLEQLFTLVESLPDVVVRPEIGEMAFEAAAAARHGASLAESGNLTGALATSRRSLALALAVSHDDSVVAQMYFSWEFKYAVYLPLGLPILVPVFVGLFRQGRQAKKRRLGARAVSEDVS